MKLGVLILRNSKPSELDKFKDRYEVIYCPYGTGLVENVAAFSEKIKAIVTSTSSLIDVNAAMIAQFPNLEIICSYGAGYECIDLEATKARGIVVTHSQNVNGESVAEHTFALILGLVRRLLAVHGAALQNDKAKFQENYAPPLLLKKRIGILGLGSIGSKIARIATGFEMKIGYHNRNRVTDSKYIYYPSILELAKNSDILVLSCPGGSSTHHIVNKEVIEALGPNGYLINVGRGSIVDTKALIAALDHDQIGGVALDVVEGEPKFPDALKGYPNVLLSPHISGRSSDTDELRLQQVLANLDAHFDGRPVLTRVST
jgi:lactate dehydrogenase-like 2-hydroxyacid dehydrogenase